jgi:hypothetical protein
VYLLALNYDSLSQCKVYHYKYYSEIRIKYFNLIYNFVEEKAS